MDWSEGEGEIGMEEAGRQRRERQRARRHPPMALSDGGSGSREEAAPSSPAGRRHSPRAAVHADADSAAAVSTAASAAPARTWYDQAVATIMATSMSPQQRKTSMWIATRLLQQTNGVSEDEGRGGDSDYIDKDAVPRLLGDVTELQELVWKLKRDVFGLHADLGGRIEQIEQDRQLAGQEDDGGTIEVLRRYGLDCVHVKFEEVRRELDVQIEHLRREVMEHVHSARGKLDDLGPAVGKVRDEHRAARGAATELQDQLTAKVGDMEEALRASEELGRAAGEDVKKIRRDVVTLRHELGEMHDELRRNERVQEQRWAKHVDLADKSSGQGFKIDGIVQLLKRQSSEGRRPENRDDGGADRDLLVRRTFDESQILARRMSNLEAYLGLGSGACGSGDGG